MVKEIDDIVYHSEESVTLERKITKAICLLFFFLQKVKT